MPTVFYSWQDDRPRTVNRNFVQSALTRAISDVNKTLSVDEPDRGDDLEIDHDTKGVPGTPEIVATILSKINDCGIFLADLTFVAETGNEKGMPNPNVLTERGYALGAVGPERMIAVMNEAYGSAGKLPFDFRTARWPIRYSLREDDDADTKREVKAGLVKNLSLAIRTIVEAGLPVVTATDIDDSWHLQSKSRVSSFLNEGDSLCTLGGDFRNQDEFWDVIWHDGPQMFLRLIPYRPSKERTAAELIELIAADSPPRPMPFGPVSGLNWEGNEFGAVVFEARRVPKQETANRIVQITNHGEIWGIDGSSLTHGPDKKGRQIIPFPEGQFLSALGKYLEFAEKKLGLDCPIRVIAGLSGVKGFALSKPPPQPGKMWFDKIEGRCVKDDIVHEVTIEEFGSSPLEALEPFFERIWGECQLPRPDWLWKDEAAK